MFWISRQRKNIEEKDCFIHFFNFRSEKKRNAKSCLCKVKRGKNMQEMSKGLNGKKLGSILSCTEIYNRSILILKEHVK